jgi:L-ribulokinase
VAFEPEPEAVRVYDRLYRMYRELHDTFGGVPGTRGDLGTLMKRLLDLREAEAR